MTITVNLKQVWLGLTDQGFSPIEGEGIGEPLYFRLEVSAESRDSWGVEAVSLVEPQIVGEVVTPIEGKFGKELADWFYHSETFAAEIQEKVNDAIIPDVSWPYETHVGGV